MEDQGSKFLHDRNPNLHHSEEVEHVVDYLKQNGENIPNDPTAKINAYLGFLANKDYVNDGIITGDEESVQRQIDLHVIKAEDVPEGYFELQRRLARERGQGDVEVTPDQRTQLIEAAQADQRTSLENWVEYLGGDDGAYPDWFKTYVWESIIKLGDYSKEEGRFQKRSKGTMSPYPEINREALAYVYDSLSKSRVEGQEPIDDEQLRKLISGGNFGKLYAHAVLEVTPDSPEAKQSIEGSWKKYDRTDDPRTARRLSESLQGHGTGWCTAGESTAKSQLHGGDFYVFYTKDQKGKDTVPRVAIRMSNGKVAEVRGIEGNQNLEGVLTDTVMDKLQDLPGGPEYQKKADDMKRLTEIDNKAQAGEALGAEDLRFLYEIDGEIQGFGYGADPRKEELIYGRNWMEDMSTIFGVTSHQEIAQQLIETGNGRAVVGYLDRFYEVDRQSIAYKLIEKDCGDALAHDFEKFRDACSDHQSIAEKIIDAGYGGALVYNLEKFNDLDHADIAQRLIEAGQGAPLADCLQKFQGLDHQSIADQLIEHGEYGFVEYLYNFHGLDQATAQRLIEEGHTNLVMYNFASFDGLDHQSIADQLIEQGDINAVAYNLDKLSGLSQETIAYVEANKTFIGI